MAMCTSCFRVRLLRWRFRRRHGIWRPTDLTNLTDRIVPHIERGALTVVQGRGQFEELMRNPLSDGVYVIAFCCVKCGEEFLLLMCKGVFEMR